jgi:hypothetical protein
MVEKLPIVEEKMSFLTAHGSKQARYTGALLWSMLDSAEMLGGDRRVPANRPDSSEQYPATAKSLALIEFSAVASACRSGASPFSAQANESLRSQMPQGRRNR